LGGVEQEGLVLKLLRCYAFVAKQNSKLYIKKTLNIKKPCPNPGSIT